jgi:hypothetical protein
MGGGNGDSVKRIEEGPRRSHMNQIMSGLRVPGLPESLA